MSDRSSAELFGHMFKKLASDPTEQHLAWAKELWKFSRNFDFSSCQMECEKALKVLGLARRRKDPEEPEEGAVWFYGPEGSEER
jgi:hypothetical protein